MTYLALFLIVASPFLGVLIGGVVLFYFKVWKGMRSGKSYRDTLLDIVNDAEPAVTHPPGRLVADDDDDDDDDDDFGVKMGSFRGGVAEWGSDIES